jgi:hypothetical protein
VEYYGVYPSDTVRDVSRDTVCIPVTEKGDYMCFRRNRTHLAHIHRANCGDAIDVWSCDKDAEFHAIEGGSCKVCADTFHYLAGWSKFTYKGFSGDVDYALGGVLGPIDSLNLKLFAVCEYKKSVLKFDKNNNLAAGFADNSKMKYSYPVYHTAIMPHIDTFSGGCKPIARTGYTFGGYWTTKDESGRRYYDANCALVSGNERFIWEGRDTTVLYAQWIADTTKLMFMPMPV